MKVETFEQEHIAYQHERTAYWDRVHTQTRQKWSDYYRKKLEAAYAQVISPGARVLELGCGQGDLLAALKPSLGWGLMYLL